MARKDATGVQFPGESKRYRSARNALLRAEAKLRKHVEDVAALRRRLPLGGEIAQDYVFDEGGADLADTQIVRQVRLSELFQPGRDTLVLYNFMYGPKMDHACPMCTSFLDALDGEARHLTQRVSLAVVARSPIQRIREHARSRGWRDFRLLSSAANTYNHDYHGENGEGGQLPTLNVFTRRKGKIFHFYSTELLFAKTERGQNSRHIDLVWPLWNVLDLTPEGRGKDWFPALQYPQV
jgi:predicted dithiol-disulfide oxidoreductase (DUF899 family)